MSLCYFYVGLHKYLKTDTVKKKIEYEKKVIEKMIRLYCHKKEGNSDLCPSCVELLKYSCDRLDKCRYGNNKLACKKCPVHCYHPDMKEKIRAVMRFAGPRMIIYHPIDAVRHFLINIH